jgi:hypothetical protein
MTTREGAAEPDPTIAAVLFCENVLFERDGTHSFIRIVDAVAMVADPSVDLTAEQSLTHPLCLAVVLRSQKLDGTVRLTVNHTPPPGGSKLEGLPTGAPVDVSAEHLTVASIRLTGGHVAQGRHAFDIRVAGGARVTTSIDVHFTHAAAAPAEA